MSTVSAVYSTVLPPSPLCREYENWHNLRALSGKFLQQKSCYPESFRFLWLWERAFQKQVPSCDMMFTIWNGKLYFCKNPPTSLQSPLSKNQTKSRRFLQELLPSIFWGWAKPNILRLCFQCEFDIQYSRTPGDIVELVIRNVEMRRLILSWHDSQHTSSSLQ